MAFGNEEDAMADRKTAWEVLGDLLGVAPRRVHTILTELPVHAPVVRATLVTVSSLPSRPQPGQGVVTADPVRHDLQGK